MKIDYTDRKYDSGWVAYIKGTINYLNPRYPKIHNDSYIKIAYCCVYGPYFRGNNFVMFGWTENTFIIAGLYSSESYSPTMPAKFGSTITGAIFQSNEGIGLETLNKLNKEHRIPSIINNELLVLRNKRKELIS